MPEYRFTTAVDGAVEHSDELMAYPNDKAASDAAQVCMAEMAKDTMPNGKYAEFAASVRDERGEEIYRAKMIFVGKGREDIAADDHETDEALEKLREALDPSHCPVRTS